jgi:cytoskeletal protein CcmA (bactofilin family)
MDKMLDENLNSPAETVVGPSVKIQGDLNSEGNIKIEGQVSGKVKTSQSVFVIAGAKIAADVLAGNAVIGGEIMGNIKVSGHLILQSTAKIAGDISCQILRVEDGAIFSGKCTMNGGPTVNSGNGKKMSGKEEELEPEE